MDGWMDEYRVTQHVGSLVKTKNLILLYIISNLPLHKIPWAFFFPYHEIIFESMGYI